MPSVIQPQGGEVPIIEARPMLDQAAGIVLRCWQDLDSARPPMPGGLGLVPWPAIVTWAQLYGAGRDETIVLADAISFLDARRLEQLASKESLR
jgi:hypothetical protein